ncbi:MAG: hydrogenase maturation protease [Candidatus Cloacimonetes bacterium]|nr:hydrogenase maturation protease [Candidatus Cloacimonadota bacterium]
MKNKLFQLLSGHNFTLFAGIGNALKSDDGVGIYISRQIIPRPGWEVLIVESGIEKFVGKINSLAPDLLILLDATDFGREPGFYDLVPLQQVRDYTANTHTVSLSRVGEFFEMETCLLGIQPADVTFGEIITAPVKASADELIEIINNLKI